MSFLRHISKDFLQATNKKMNENPLIFGNKCWSTASIWFDHHHRPRLIAASLSDTPNSWTVGEKMAQSVSFGEKNIRHRYMLVYIHILCVHIYVPMFRFMCPDGRWCYLFLAPIDARVVATMMGRWWRSCSAHQGLPSTTQSHIHHAGGRAAWRALNGKNPSREGSLLQGRVWLGQDSSTTPL